MITGLMVLAASAQAEDAMARVYLDKGEYERALFYYEKLFGDNPYNMNYLAAVVKCYQQLERFDDAHAMLQRELQRPGIPPAVHIEIGYNHLLQQDEELAREAFSRAMEAIEENPSYAYMVGQGFREKQLLDEAVAAFKKGMELNPKLNFSYDLAYIYGEQGDLEKMYNTYLDLILLRTKLKENIKRNIGRFLFADSSNMGSEVLRRVLLQRVQSDPNIVWNELLSWLFVQQRKYRLALTQEKAIYKRQEQPELGGITDLGMIAYDEGDLEVATDAFTFVSENAGDPATQIEAHTYLMRIRTDRAEQGDEARMLKDFDGLLDAYGRGAMTVQLQILRARFMAFNAGRPETAIAELQQLMEEPMDRYSKAVVKMELADILVYQEHFNRALIYYSQLQKELKNDVKGQMARYKVARTSFYKGDFDWAESQLKVLKASTSQLIANDALQLKLLISDNKGQDSLQLALKKFARAHLLAYQHQREAAITVLDTLLAEHRGEPVEDEALMMQAELYREGQAFEKAELNYRKVIEFFPDDIYLDDALFQLAVLYLEELNDPEKAKPLLERIIFDHQDSIYFPEARTRFRELRGDTVN